MDQHRERDIEYTLANDLLTTEAKELLQSAVESKNEKLIECLLSPRVFFDLGKFEAESVSNFIKE